MIDEQPYLRPTGTDSADLKLSLQSKRLSLQLIIILSLSGIFLFAGGVWGINYYFKFPDLTVQQMINAALSVKSLAFTGIITGQSVSYENDLDLPFLSKQNNFNIMIDGKSDVSDAATPKLSFLIIFNIKNNNQNDVNFEFEFRNIDNIMYLNLKPSPSLNLDYLNSISNQWLKFDFTSIKQQFGQAITDQIDVQTKAQNQVTAEKIAQIKELIKESSVIKVTDRLANEIISGHHTYHYQLTFKKDDLEDLIAKIITIISDPEVVQKELDKFRDDWQDLDMPTAEIWIGRDDLLPYGLLFTFNLNEVEKINSQGEITVDLKFGDYNQPLQIEKPANALSFEELLNQIMLNQSPSPDLLMDSDATIVDFETDSDSDDLSDYLENYFNTDPNNSDSDGDGYQDGEEVQNGYNPLGPGRL